MHSQSQIEDHQNLGMSTKLVPHPVNFDMLDGHVRFFGATNDMHVLSRPASDTSMIGPSWFVPALVLNMVLITYDNLIEVFFECNNTALQIVHKFAFLNDLKSEETQFYSNFLHMAMLTQKSRYSSRYQEAFFNLAQQWFIDIPHKSQKDGRVGASQAEWYSLNTGLNVIDRWVSSFDMSTSIMRYDYQDSSLNTPFAIFYNVYS